MFLPSITKISLLPLTLGLALSLGINNSHATNGKVIYYENSEPNEWAPVSLSRVNPQTGNSISLQKLYETATAAFYQVHPSTPEPDDAMCSISPSSCKLIRTPTDP
ncbi:MAG: hypothetical protein HRT35_14775 [Algicola sp.]|nr:hypothetical protein [Algicola sp.]